MNMKDAAWDNSPFNMKGLNIRTAVGNDKTNAMNEKFNASNNQNGYDMKAAVNDKPQQMAAKMGSYIEKGNAFMSELKPKK